MLDFGIYYRVTSLEQGLSVVFYMMSDSECSTQDFDNCLMPPRWAVNTNVWQKSFIFYFFLWGVVGHGLRPLKVAVTERQP